MTISSGLLCDHECSFKVFLACNPGDFYYSV